MCGKDFKRETALKEHQNQGECKPASVEKKPYPRFHSRQSKEAFKKKQSKGAHTKGMKGGQAKEREGGVSRPKKGVRLKKQFTAQKGPSKEASKKSGAKGSGGPKGSGPKGSGPKGSGSKGSRPKVRLPSGSTLDEEHNWTEKQNM
jgi:23S rRNA pseudouridine2605 synthase